jgi:hypothetical protein
VLTCNPQPVTCNPQPVTCKLFPPLALQLRFGGTYSAPYVAVDSNTDPPSNPSGRLLTPCTPGAYAAPAQRGLGSGVRVGHDREHIRRPDFFGIDESHSLSWRDLFRGNFDTYFFDRETKSGTARWRSRKGSQDHKTIAERNSIRRCFLQPGSLRFSQRLRFGNQQPKLNAGSDTNRYRAANGFILSFGQ